MVDGGNTDTLFTSRGNTVTTNGSRWIAGGFGTNTGGYMLLGYSDNNGQTWSKVTDPIIDTFNEIYGSHWDGNRFWIGGTGSNIKLAYSYNGLNWTFFENPGAYFLKPRGFLSYDSVLIMGGDTLGLYLSAISLDNGNNFSSGIRIDEFFTGTGKTIHSFACKFTPPPPEPPPVPPVANFAKGVSMPLKIGVSDSQSTFFLGRKAFLKNINESHRPENSGKNLDYSSVQNKISSNVFGKPLNSNSHALRMQRLRLSTIGIGSLKVNNENEQITLGSVDQNFVNSARSRVRGSGGGGPKR
jgi:hypothetical protein